MIPVGVPHEHRGPIRGEGDEPSLPLQEFLQPSEEVLS